MSEEKLTIEEKMTIKELEEKIKGMKEDKERKCKAAKEQLVSMLEVTVDKYRTATGTAEALRVLRFTSENYPCEINILSAANRLAHDMAVVTSSMCEKAKSLSYAKMDSLCEGYYDEDFVLKNNDYNNCIQLAEQMMRIDLCRNVGGAAEDMVEFIKRVELDIDATGEELKKLRAKEK